MHGIGFVRYKNMLYVPLCVMQRSLSMVVAWVKESDVFTAMAWQQLDILSLPTAS
jgi:hypothetical protein